MSEAIKAAVEVMKQKRDAEIKARADREEQLKNSVVNMENTMSAFVEDIHQELRNQAQDVMIIGAPVRSTKYGSPTVAHFPPRYTWGVSYDDFKPGGLVAEMISADEIDLFRYDNIKSTKRYKCRRKDGNWSYHYSAFSDFDYVISTSLTSVVEKVLLDIINNLEHEKAILK